MRSPGQQHQAQQTTCRSSYQALAPPGRPQMLSGWSASSNPPRGERGGGWRRAAVGAVAHNPARLRCGFYGAICAGSTSHTPHPPQKRGRFGRGRHSALFTRPGCALGFTARSAQDPPPTLHTRRKKGGDLAVGDIPPCSPGQAALWVSRRDLRRIHLPHSTPAAKKGAIWPWATFRLVHPARLRFGL